MKKRIAVIEDGKDNWEAIRHLLSDHEVLSANNIVDFYRFQSDSPDLFIIDDYLHEGFGNQLYLSLKKNPQTRNIPVILITDKDRSSEIKDTGFSDDFVTKPFNPGYLVHKVINLTGVAQSQQYAASKEKL